MRASQARNGGLGQLAEVYGVAPRGAARDPGESEQIVDELRHVSCRLPHRPQKAPPLLIELVGVVFEQGLTEPVDGSKRGAEVVRHRIAE